MNIDSRLSKEDHRQRHALLKALLELRRQTAIEGWTTEDAVICWAIRLAAYEGHRADMHFLVEKTGLTRQTIQRRLAELRNARNIVAHWPSRRKEYVLSPEDANERGYYAALLLTLNKWCEEAYPGCKCPPSKGSEQSDG